MPLLNSKQQMNDVILKKDVTEYHKLYYSQSNFKSFDEKEFANE